MFQENEPITGVKTIPLKTHRDDRGSLTVLYNQLWGIPFDLAQLNLVQSESNSLRGVHVHSTHSDYLCVLKGTMMLGLRDLRRNSTSFGQTTLYTLTTESPKVFIVPPGVGHGFYFPDETLYCYGLSHPWDADEKLGCRWNAPDLGIPWPTENPLLSERDANAGTVTHLLEQMKDTNI